MAAAWEDQLTSRAPPPPARARTACDLSAGGSIYVPNKQELALSPFPPLRSAKRRLSLSKEIRWLDLWYFVAGMQNPICEEDTSNQMKMEGI